MKDRLTSIIRNAFFFKNGNRRYKYLVLGHEETYFVKEHSDPKNKYSDDDIIKMLEFLVDNIFVVFAGKVFQVGWLVVLKINVDLAIFQPYLDLEAGDNQSLKIQVARPGIEPRSSCSASQELNHSATTAPKKSSSRQSAFQWVQIVPRFSSTYFCIHTKRISYSLCSQRERNI